MSNVYLRHFYGLLPSVTILSAVKLIYIKLLRLKHSSTLLLLLLLVQVYIQSFCVYIISLIISRICTMYNRYVYIIHVYNIVDTSDGRVDVKVKVKLFLCSFLFLLLLFLYIILITYYIYYVDGYSFV